MTDLELNAIAEGLLTYVKSISDDPRDGLAIFGIALCHLYDDSFDKTKMPFSTFADQFRDSLIATRKDVSHQGPVTRQ